MANIKINDLQSSEFEFVELSDLELEGIVGGKSRGGRNILGVAAVVGRVTGVLPYTF